MMTVMFKHKNQKELKTLDQQVEHIMYHQSQVL